MCNEVASKPEVVRFYRTTQMPKSVQIGPLEYTVEARSEDIDCIGNVDPKSQIMWIDTSSGRDQQALTLLHEIIHAVQEHLGAKSIDEWVVEAMAFVLLDTLRRNSELVAYLMGE